MSEIENDANKRTSLRALSVIEEAFNLCTMFGYGDLKTHVYKRPSKLLNLKIENRISEVFSQKNAITISENDSVWNLYH